MPQMPADMDYFVEHLPKAYVGLGLAALCAVLGSLGFLDADASTGMKLGLAIPCFFLAALFVVMAFRPASKHAGIVAFRDRRADIVWIYVFRRLVNGRHASSSLVICLVDGRQTELPIKKGREEEFARYAASLVPHARTGHSPELARQFKADPRSFLQ
jgi:hypothetical protein